ncbi:hypothetical protein J1N10_08475 [Carboxylicivirga sp. A043]|uniref:hypothetical protein n=1 Tax=Carboxylicivirga litoralis TaxID=2816963 RepID=UPI0021CB81CE|nr:hypothetical protein [Carboxylicivirga sp. A043]MCU4156010.1 hypothetical protein [Carboxylicivirga sp. A043]
MKKILLLLTACLIAGAGYAQKLKTLDGKPDCIKGDQNINIIFTYDDLKVGKMSEADYIERETAERNEKEAGTGDEWAVKWEKDQEDRYPPKFIELFNIHGDKLFGSKVVANSETAKYTICVNTPFIEPGFNVGVMRKPAKTNHIITIYETAKPDVILHKLEIIASPGTGAAGYDFDAGYRIQEAFAKAAKEYAQFMYKKHLK